ncbi:MAG: hypothetical protein ACXABD_04545 [Candidatus Thorarchaeota archaeon]|jgi:hypothetical protein
MFYVFNQAGDDGFHEIKNEAGEVVATAADTDEQTTTTLEVLGHKDAEVEVVYDQATWEALSD